MIELIASGAVAATAGYFLLNDQPMRPAPSKEGKVLCDFHAHPSKKNKLEDIVQMLGSPGLVGLAAKYIDKSGGGRCAEGEEMNLVQIYSFIILSRRGSRI